MDLTKAFCPSNAPETSQKRKRNASDDDDGPLRRKPSTDLSKPQGPNFPFSTSPPIIDRASTFTAYYSPTLSASALLRLLPPETLTATHLIRAWRRPSTLNKTSLTFYDTGHDSDGEAHAGTRARRTLESLRAEGSCVVARWYGGVLLGPVRFEHVEACVRKAVEAWRRREEEERERERLVRELEERDRRIGILRGLVREREGRVKRTIPTPPPPVVNYSGMELEILRALDRARDATVTFLLQRIDKVEADLAALERDSPPPPPD
ncbi:hypothetical protein M433DRAFT_68515 [Acidomyces richmondensis BFW]|nr:MAG: hypothetical protein FE78DRAFT_150693 [Acidomyces sp. 'richmondensis']KYG44844.1 hypothetical protein M433DRAFT_68515 [Acidomyces richmondensis BFW]